MNDNPDYVSSVQVTLVQPPWYWRMIGRVYWKGWFVTATLRDSDDHRLLANECSPPAPKPPTPTDVAQATQDAMAKALNKLMESLIE